MQLTTLKTKIQNGEDSYTQFKVNITNSDKLAEELVAFSNARGGLLIIGVDDNGVVVGVEDKDIRRLNQLIDKKLLVIEIEEGVEIINPGKLTNSLTVDKIKRGISIHRNPILNSIARYVLNYSGRGSGIKRVLRTNPNVEFINDIEKEEFRCIIPRLCLS